MGEVTIRALSDEASTLNNEAYLVVADTDGKTKKIKGSVVKGSVPSKYSSGWAQSFGGVGVANGATLPITHNLGTTDVIAKVYAKIDGDPWGTRELATSTESESLVVTNLLNNSLDLQLQGGFWWYNANGVDLFTDYSSAYYTTSLNVVVMG